MNVQRPLTVRQLFVLGPSQIIIPHSLIMQWWCICKTRPSRFIYLSACAGWWRFDLHSSAVVAAVVVVVIIISVVSLFGLVGKAARLAGRNGMRACAESITCCNSMWRQLVQVTSQFCIGFVIKGSSRTHFRNDQVIWCGLLYMPTEKVNHDLLCFLLVCSKYIHSESVWLRIENASCGAFRITSVWSEFGLKWNWTIIPGSSSVISRQFCVLFVSFCC